MNDRLGPIPFAHMSASQQVAAQAVIDGPRSALYGPFVPLIPIKSTTPCSPNIAKAAA